MLVIAFLFAVVLDTVTTVANLVFFTNTVETNPEISTAYLRSGGIGIFLIKGYWFTLFAIAVSSVFACGRWHRMPRRIAAQINFNLAALLACFGAFCVFPTASNLTLSAIDITHTALNLPGLVSMAIPRTAAAIAVIVSGVALANFANLRSGRDQRLFIVFIAALAALVALITLSG